MDDETQQIFEEQLKKLPIEVVDFLSSANWEKDLDEIGALYNLSEDELYNFKSEATLVLEGLVHPDAFGDNLEQEAGMHGAVRDAIVATVEQRIFATVRDALVDFFDSEAQNDAEQTQTNAEEGTKQSDEPNVTHKSNLTPNTSNLTPARAPQLSGAAPDNLPVAEAPEYLVPPIPPKTGDESAESAHPFEEKMKRVFTAGQQSMGELTLEPVAPQAPSTAHTHYDPYRETIE